MTVSGHWPSDPRKFQTPANSEGLCCGCGAGAGRVGLLVGVCQLALPCGLILAYLAPQPHGRCLVCREMTRFRFIGTCEQGAVLGRTLRPARHRASRARKGRPFREFVRVREVDPPGRCPQLANCTRLRHDKNAIKIANATSKIQAPHTWG